MADVSTRMEVPEITMPGGKIASGEVAPRDSKQLCENVFMLGLIRAIEPHFEAYKALKFDSKPDIASYEDIKALPKVYEAGKAYFVAITEEGELAKIPKQYRSTEGKHDIKLVEGRHFVQENILVVSSVINALVPAAATDKNFQIMFGAVAAGSKAAKDSRQRADFLEANAKAVHDIAGRSVYMNLSNQDKLESLYRMFKMQAEQPKAEVGTGVGVKKEEPADPEKPKNTTFNFDDLIKAGSQAVLYKPTDAVDIDPANLSALLYKSDKAADLKLPKFDDKENPFAKKTGGKEVA